MSITHAEKQSIVERIEKRINEAVNKVKADNALEYRRIEAQVRARALTNLQISEVMGELAQNEGEIARLTKRNQELRDLVDRAFGTSINHYHWDSGYEQELKAYYRADLRAALQQTEWGARRNALIAERNNLVDTVLVATSSKELKTLWANFNALLGIEATPMEQKALAAGETEPKEA